MDMLEYSDWVDGIFCPDGYNKCQDFEYQMNDQDDTPDPGHSFKGMVKERFRDLLIAPKLSLFE